MRLPLRERTSFRWSREALPLAAAAAAAISVTSADALGWTFPEHAVITEDGLASLPVAARHALQRGFSDALRAASSDPVKPPLDGEMCRPFLQDGPDAEDDPIPFVALPALAADHSTTVVELKARIIEQQAALGSTRVSRRAWRTFLGWRHDTGKDTAASVDPSKHTMFVNNLDVALLLADGLYVDRAHGNVTHFAVPEESLSWTLNALVEQGRTDNALAQFVVNHLRSLQLAARSRDRTAPSMRLEAFLEHAFAVHFLQDAFSAGHAAVAADDRADSQRRARRHSHFNRIGLQMTSALNQRPCAAPRIGVCSGTRDDPSCENESADAPCWTTFGDGFLGVSGDGRAPDEEAPDRAHAALATARTQMLFALALEGPQTSCLSPKAPVARGPRLPACFQPEQSCDAPSPRLSGAPDQVMAYLMDPASRLAPLWYAECRSAEKIFEGAGAALQELADHDWTVPPIDANVEESTPQSRRIVPAEWVGTPFATPPIEDSSCEVYPPVSKPSRKGVLGVYLLRPVLAAWPVPVAPAGDLPGEDAQRVGMGFHFWGAPGLVLGTTPQTPYLGPSLTAGFGLSYRAEALLPARPNAALAEVGIGLSARWLLPLDGGEPRDELLWIGELRSPIFSALLWTGLAALRVPVEDFQAYLNLVPLGGRLHLGTDALGDFGVRGFDFEGPALVLPWATAPGASARISALPWELRTRFGWSLPRANEWADVTFLFGVELAGGVSHSILP